MNYLTNAYKWNINNNVKKRKWTDTILSSHIFLIIAQINCFIGGVNELGLYMFPVILSSIMYHKSGEQKLQYKEAILAHGLLFYAIIQIPFASNMIIIIIECLLFLCVSLLFFYTSTNQYDYLHPIQHILASIWVSLIGLFHNPFII